MRGSKYAFLNKTRLQQSIRSLGKDYRHIRDLAPTTEIRALQKQEDSSVGILKQERLVLSEAFIAAYEQQVLGNKFDIEAFCDNLEGVESMAFFCVEGHPKACHRSIAAAHVAKYFGVSVEDLIR